MSGRVSMRFSISTDRYGNLKYVFVGGIYLIRPRSPVFLRNENEIAFRMDLSWGPFREISVIDRVNFKYYNVYGKCHCLHSFDKTIIR